MPAAPELIIPDSRQLARINLHASVSSRLYPRQRCDILCAPRCTLRVTHGCVTESMRNWIKHKGRLDWLHVSNARYFLLLVFIRGSAVFAHRWPCARDKLAVCRKVLSMLPLSAPSHKEDCLTLGSIRIRTAFIRLPFYWM